MNRCRNIDPNLPHRIYGRQFALLAACLASLSLVASAATPILNFDFNETSAAAVKESVNGLTGTPSDPAPTMVTDSPSGQANDLAVNFDTGQKITVDDPEMKMSLDQGDPSFTLQAWVKFSGNPSTRAVFFYNNGPGAAISFSVNTDRTVFVTTLGILDASSAAAIPDDDKWHHIAVVHQNGVELRYYVDGVLGDTRAYTSGVIFTRTETSFTLGSEPNGGLQYVGSLDRLKVTSGALPVDELDFKPAVGPVTDVDKDGIPDDWEIKYGLNPNDATDAAKDCNGNGLTNLQEFQKGLEPCDTTKPEVVSASTTGTFDTVKITFSKELDPTTATNAANYTISPSLAITAVTYKSKVVTLTTAKQTAGGTAYTVTVKGIKDVSNFEVPADKNSATFFSYLMTTQGMLKFSYWGSAFGGTQIDGTTVDLLTSDPRYPASPDAVGAVYRFSSRDFFPDDTHEYFGATMEGFLTPTEAANYRFFVYSDDSSELWLSTDATEGNLQKIAEETGCCNNFTEPDSPRTSEPIALKAGTKYFIRLIYKEGGGGDYGLVAWRKEGDTTPAANLSVIPGKYLSSAIDLPYPSEGVTTLSPAAKATGVKPNASVSIGHNDGKSPWTSANVSLKLDGATVTPTYVKDGAQSTITVPSSGLLASGSTHTLDLTYPDPSGKAATLSWSFTVTSYSGPVKDTVAGVNALLIGKAVFSPDKGGHTATAGDYAIDFGKVGGAWVDIIDASFMNVAAAKDELSFSFWVYRYDINASSAFWANSASAGRGFQAHTPWSDDTIYFDTMGCCDGTTQRISANISEFGGYGPDDTWWNKWHQFVFTKKGDQKNIYIDGQLFLNGSSSNPLKADFTEIGLGTDGIPGADMMHGMIDDFAVFSTEISPANAAKLAGGTSPKDITGAGLLALWDFNTVPAVAPNLGIAQSGANITITFGGTLQSSSTVDGTFSDVAGATSPYIVTPSGTKFYRAKQ